MNMEENIYTSIAERTNGDIYVGVVGPVRTGKSTFIKKFMDLMVLPNIENEYARERARDELPQSANGRTIMTTEPKFVPNEAVEIMIDDNVSMRVRLVDCVGYLVRGAIGHFENDAPRLVSTPWYDYQIPFYKAAEIGTRKVITEHSSLGIVVTTDGSFTEMGREDYLEAEERVIKELKELNKPFIVVINSANPKDPYTVNLQEELEEKHCVPVIAVNCAFLKQDDINDIFDRLLYEFPIYEVSLRFPGWVGGLEKEHEIRKGIYGTVKDSFKDIKKIREIHNAIRCLKDGNDSIKKVYMEKISLGEGKVTIDIALRENIFYNIISELSGIEIDGERMLFKIVKEFSQVKKEYDKIKDAINDVTNCGYGIVMPQLEELRLEEPQIIKQGGRYGVKLKASAPSVHLIKAEIETEIAPLVGSEKQSQELLDYLMKEFEGDPSKLWASNIFGKSLHELVSEGLNNKIGKMPIDARSKLQETLQRIINEGSNGLVCIIV
jgi:stage IV sporulation protein A